MPFIMKFDMHNLFCKLHAGSIHAPTSWSTTELSGIPKVPVPRSLDKFRWVGKQSQAQKTLIRTLAASDRFHLGGHPKGHVMPSSTVVVSTVFEALYWASEWDLSLFTIFGDIRAAHDRVHLSSQVQALYYQGFSATTTRAIMSQRFGENVVLNFPGASASTPISRNVGLTQGDPEASRTFGAILDKIFDT